MQEDGHESETTHTITLHDTTCKHFQVCGGIGNTHFILNYCTFSTVPTLFSLQQIVTSTTSFSFVTVPNGHPMIKQEDQNGCICILFSPTLQTGASLSAVISEHTLDNSSSSFVFTLLCVMGCV